MVEPGEWQGGLGIPDEVARRFEELAATLDIAPHALVAMMIARAIELDDRLRGFGLNGVGVWRTKTEAAADIADDAVAGMPLDVRKTGFMWPADLPFPWTAEECKAAVIGYQVRWHGNFDDFLERLRGSWEMSDGYAMLRQR